MGMMKNRSNTVVLKINGVQILSYIHHSSAQVYHLSRTTIDRIVISNSSR